MRIGIIADVHGDASALRDALAQLHRLSCDFLVCAGDLLDYGRDPDEAVALIRESRFPCVRGNHDYWAVEDQQLFAPETLAYLSALPPAWNTIVDGVLIAVRHGSAKDCMDGIYPNQEDAGDLREDLARADADVLIVGHTHLLFSIEGPAGLIVNPGALLRDASPVGYNTTVLYDHTQRKMVRTPCRGAGGTFGVLELPSKRFTVHLASDGSEVEIIRKVL
ncbi:MAG: metallophosphoesterase family protein [Acidobacteriota bacterium]